MAEESSSSFSGADIGQITSLEAAQVALRWLSEKQSSLDGENRELRSKFEAVTAVQEEKQKQLEVLSHALQERGSRLQEQEVFFKKLGATYQILSEGKLDISLIVQKQLELDTLQKRLIEEHQHRLVDLERSQQQIQERWHERLLELESQYAERLNGARRQFESLRRAQDGAGQEQIKKMEEHFKDNEARLAQEKERLTQESSQKKLEMEAALAQKESANEQEFETLKTRLCHDVEAERAAMAKQSDERQKIMAATWTQEKTRLEEDLRRHQALAAQRQEQLRASEETTAKLQSSYHDEVVSKIAAYEETYRRRLEEIEARERDMATRYLARQQELETALNLRQRTLDEQATTLKSRTHENEQELRANFDREKALLDEELRAALETSQGLTRQIHELEEARLQEAMRLEAERANLAEELRREKETAETVRRDREAIRQNYQTRVEAATQELAAAKMAYQRLESSHKELESKMAQWKAEQDQEVMKKSGGLETEHRARIEQIDRESARREGEFAQRDKALAAEHERLYQDIEKRRLELDELEHVLIKRLEDLEASKQSKEREWHEREEELRRRDQQWSQHRSRLERIYHEKAATLEEMKHELLKEIDTYKNAKIK
ncbi:MAG: hypothetical protein AAB091_00870 [Elusimicrobiota bacterium]